MTDPTRDTSVLPRSRRRAAAGRRSRADALAAPRAAVGQWSRRCGCGAYETRRIFRGEGLLRTRERPSAGPRRKQEMWNAGET